MYLKLEIAIQSLASLYWDARSEDPPCWQPDPDRPRPRCALCGAREYPHRFPLPYPWPRLHEVVTSITNRDSGVLHAVMTGDTGRSLYFPVEDEDNRTKGDDRIYLYHFCRYHGRPETSGWVNGATNVRIEWFPEPSGLDLALLNITIRLAYILWVTGRFLWSLLTFQFVAVRVKVKRHPW